MSAISKLAKASPGVIYHHFASKNQILQAVYERARILKRGSLLQGYDPRMPDKEAFILVALNAYTFYRRYHKMLRFAELYEDVGFPIPAAALKPTPQAIAFRSRFCSKSQGGVLGDLPHRVVEEMTFGLVMRLAKQRRRLPEAILRKTAEGVWRAIKA